MPGRLGGGLEQKKIKERQGRREQNEEGGLREKIIPKMGAEIKSDWERRQQRRALCKIISPVLFGG